MMRSLFSGVSGLKVHQTKMDVIGNNIANVNTVGFKSQSVMFTDIFYQTTQVASGSNAATGAGGQNAKQIGLGASIGAISVNIAGQGGSQRTDNALDLMINGDEFFIVSSNGSTCFTKAGNFTTDDTGTLVTSGGAQVLGWQADMDGVVRKDRVSALRIMSEEEMTSPPEATTNTQLFGNINKQSSAFTKANEYEQYEPVAIKFFDSLGYSYEAVYHVKQAKDDEGSAIEGAYSLNLFSISCEGENLAQARLIPSDGDQVSYYEYLTESPIYFGFNTTGNAISNTDGSLKIPSGTLVNVSSSSVDDVLQENFDPDDDPRNIEMPLVFADVDEANWVNSDGRATTCPEALAGKSITIDFSQITNYGTSTSIDSAYGDLEGSGKGKSVGKMNSIGVQTDGKVVASYSNGDMLVLGQIAVASFANASGLEKVGDNLYAATLNSGTFNGIGEDITASGDNMTSGVLEMSNVDLSSEFTEMITTQRGFQANSRIITTSDTLLEELINLKR
jgi:flagellar hook protein FlgE